MKRRTIIVDLDGCIIKHKESGPHQQWYGSQQLLPGVKEAFAEWESESACIVIMTARPECTRKSLERILDHLEIFYEQLIMGVGHGERILINDSKPFGPKSAQAWVLPRNEGLVSCMQ